MDHRVLAVAVLAVTAGCGGLAADGEPVGTVTPAPVPEPTTAEGDPSDLAPGLESTGVVDVHRLADAHLDAIRGTSYVWTYRYSAIGSGDDGNADAGLEKHLRVSDEREYVYTTTRRRVRMRGRLFFLANYTEYTDGRFRYSRYKPVEAGAPMEYQRYWATSVTRRFGTEATNEIRRFLAVENATVSAVTVRGQQYYRVRGERDVLPGEGAVSDYEATALVAESGFVRSLNVTYVVEAEDRRASHSFAYDRRDVDIDRPEWVTERWGAVQTETAVDGERFDDG